LRCPLPHNLLKAFAGTLQKFVRRPSPRWVCARGPSSSTPACAHSVPRLTSPPAQCSKARQPARRNHPSAPSLPLTHTPVERHRTHTTCNAFSGTFVAIYISSQKGDGGRGRGDGGQRDAAAQLQLIGFGSRAPRLPDGENTVYELWKTLPRTTEDTRCRPERNLRTHPG
jgi:hypothetical protein